MHAAHSPPVCYPFAVFRLQRLDTNNADCTPKSTTGPFDMCKEEWCVVCCLSVLLCVVPCGTHARSFPSVLEISTEGVGCLFSHSNCGEYISDSRVAPSPSCSTTFDYILPVTGPIAARQIAFTAARTNTKRRGLAIAVGYAPFFVGSFHSFLTTTSCPFTDPTDHI